MPAIALSHRFPGLQRALHYFAGAEGAVWLAIAAVLVLARIMSSSFLDPVHLLNVARQVSSLAIVTTGQVFVIITGGLDLSNGMVITLVTVLSASILDGESTYIVPVVFLCLGLGLVVGLVNGLLIAKLHIPPLIGTLGTYGILKGIAYVYTSGAPKGDVPPVLSFVGNGHVGPIPVAVICAAIFVAIGAVVLRRTLFGRRLFAVGANPRTARLSGVDVDRMIILAYVFSGFSAAVAGLVVAGYVGTGSLSVGNTYNLDSIAAAVIGGTALSGGSGSVIGGAGGALFLALVVSLLRFLGLSYSGQLIVQGAILAFAIVAQSRAQRSR
jgi:ribose transport system permease protein